ncbi:MAG: hypothetical protein COC06_12015 [Bacteroidales bacterium]|nr:MAG: hypothetical protein COC06_12015 [Bacteroidales bacterium]
MLESSIGTPNYNELSYNIDNFKNGALKYLFLTKQKEFISATASMALFYCNYDYIKKLWEYRQPRDTIAINGGNDILPNNLLEIFKVYIDSHNIPFFKYPLEDNHDIEVYIRKYAVLLFLRQYTLQSFLITDRYLAYDYIPSNLKHEELHNWEYYLEQFKNLYLHLKNDKELLSALNLDFELEANVKAPDIIIEDLIKLLKEQREINIVRSELDGDVISHFKENLLRTFIGQNFFYSIANLFGNIEFKIETERPDIRTYKHQELIDKAPMSKLGDHVMHINHGGGHGQSIANTFSHDYYFTLKKLFKENNLIVETSKENLSGELIKSQLDDNYLIMSVNFSFLYGLNDIESKFKSLDFIDENIDHSAFEGKYDKTPVFTYHNRSLPKSIFILDRNILPKILVHKFDHPDGLAPIVDGLYFSAKDLNAQENKDTLDKYIEDSTIESNSYEEQLRKYVEIRIENFAEILDSKIEKGVMLIIKE